MVLRQRPWRPRCRPTEGGDIRRGVHGGIYRPTRGSRVETGRLGPAVLVGLRWDHRNGPGRPGPLSDRDRARTRGALGLDRFLRKVALLAPCARG